MIRKKILILAGLSAGLLMLSGCEMLGESKWTPQEPSAISIDKKGVITEYVKDTLDQSYYDVTELQSMITSQVDDYNGTHGEDTITVEKFETTENGEVSLEMKYASAEDYEEFNNTEFYYGSMINAQLEGYLFDATYKRVKDGVVESSSVSGSEVIKEMAQQVLIVRAPLEVHVPGNVLYTSTNAEVLSSDVVNATGEQDEDEGATIVLPSSAVYKTEESSFAEQTAANRVYIIFEME